MYQGKAEKNRMKRIKIRVEVHWVFCRIGVSACFAVCSYNGVYLTTLENGIILCFGQIIQTWVLSIGALYLKEATE